MTDMTDMTELQVRATLMTAEEVNFRAANGEIIPGTDLRSIELVKQSLAMWRENYHGAYVEADGVRLPL